MEYIPPELVRDAASPDLVFHPPLGAPVRKRDLDVFDDRSLTLTESRTLRANLADLVATLDIRAVRFSRGTFKLTVAPGGQPFVIERSMLAECIKEAHAINLRLSIEPSAPQEAA